MALIKPILICLLSGSAVCSAVGQSVTPVAGHRAAGISIGAGSTGGNGGGKAPAISLRRETKIVAASEPVTVVVQVASDDRGLPVIASDAGESVTRAAKANPGRLVLIDVRGLPLVQPAPAPARNGASVAGAHAITESQRAASVQAARYEDAMADGLERLISGVQSSLPASALAVIGLPLESSGSAPTNERYAKVLALQSVIAPAGGLLASGAGEAQAARSRFPNAVRAATGRPVVFRGGDGWRLTVPPTSAAGTGSNAATSFAATPAIVSNPSASAGNFTPQALVGGPSGEAVTVGQVIAGWGAAGASDVTGDGITNGYDLAVALGDEGESTPTVPSDGPFVVPGSGWTEPTPEPAAVGDLSLKAASERAIARWSIAPYQTVASDFNLGVVADHYNGIAYVEFRVDGGPPQSINVRRLNPQTGVNEFYATLQVANCPDGLHEVRATVFPVAGVPRVLQGAITSGGGTGSHSMFVSTNRDGTLSTDVAWVAPDGSDTTGDGTEQSPYLTLCRAGFALAGGVAGGDAGGGRILLKPGSYNLGTYSYAKRFSSPIRYITIEPGPNVSPTDVKIVSSSQDGLRTDLVHFKNLTLSPLPGAVYPIRSANNQGIAWFDGCYFTAQNWDDSSTLNWYMGWKARVFTDCSVFWVRGTPYNGMLARNCSINFVADDAFKNTPVILNCTVKDLGPHNTGLHADVWQSWNPNGTVQNCYVDNLVATDTISAQGLFFHGWTNLFLDCAFRNITIDNSNNGEGTVFVNLHMHRPVQHVLFRNCTLISGGLYRTGQDPSTPQTSHNIFSAINMLMEDVVKDTANAPCVPSPDGPGSGGPGPWPGTLPWDSPLGVRYVLGAPSN